MNSNFWNEMMNLDNITTTTNGDKAYKTSNSGLMDLMFKGGLMKHSSYEESIKLFKKAYDEHPIAAIRLLFYIRDIRGGQGCRNFFRHILNFLAINKPKVFKKIIDYIPEYGRWDDMIQIISEINNKEIFDIIIKKILEQIVIDLKNIKDNKPISILFKWLPSENTSSKKTISLAKTIRKALKLSSKEYRKTLSLGRKYLNIVERNICTNDFSSIDYSTVPSLAMIKYKKLFNQKDTEHFNDYISSLVKGETKVNAKTLYPYDIIKQMEDNWFNMDNNLLELLDKQWKALPNFFEDKSDNSIVVADVSGSMVGTPLNVCISLALYIAERNKGAFQNKVISFSANPTLINLSDSFNNLRERMCEMKSIEWGMNTNIDKVFNLLFEASKRCSKDEIPSSIYIISDMQFDACCENSSKSIFEKWTTIFKGNGLKLPRIIFWNVSEFGCNTIPVTVNDRGVLCISGFSPSILKYIMNNPSMDNTYELIEEIIFNNRYSMILNDIEDYTIF